MLIAASLIAMINICSFSQAAAAAASQAKGGHVPGERGLIVFIPQYFLSASLIFERLFVPRNVGKE